MLQVLPLFKTEIITQFASLLPLQYWWFRFAKFTDKKQLMSVKEENPSSCKLYAFYEEIPEENLDETDVDSYFYQNIFDNSQFHHRIVRVSKGGNRNDLQSRCSNFEI